MSTESPRPEIPQNIDFEVIGSGTIGLKAEQLLQKTAKLREIGFKTPKRTALAQGFLEDIDVNVLQSVIDGYHHSPLAIRSSAAGDARGTGVYESVFVENDLKSVLEGVDKVMESYDSSAAVAFRRDAKTGEGMGILIEPMIGQEVEGLFLPLLSGYGYTSTLKDEGYLGIVPGFGGGVSVGGAEEITKSVFKERGGSFRDYIRSRLMEISDRTPLFNSALLGTDSSGRLSNNYGLFAYYKNKLSYQDMASRGQFGELVKRSELLPIFEMMKKMENVFGVPQYFEWAITNKGEDQSVWILQIADVSRNIDVLEFGDFGEVIIQGGGVMVSGEKEIDTIVYCTSYEELEALAKFNENSSNYLLIASQDLSSRVRESKNRMGYSHINNASFLLEIGSIPHLKGLFESVNKPAAIISPANITEAFEDKFYKGKELREMKGRFKVVASIRSGRMVVYEIKD